MEQNCLDNGTYYVDEACGPRAGDALYMSNAQWRATYTAHRAFDSGRVQSFAGKFEQLAKDGGGGSNGYAAQRIADAWFKRNVALGEDQAGDFFRAVCRQMRIESEYTDIGPGFSNFSRGTMPYLLGDFLYMSCKADKGFEMCSNPFAMSVVDNVYELEQCLFDHPQCRRDRELCLGKLLYPNQHG
tara:strand:+ start:1169 stop:1726 length:558 start_codon:yes stop_codon:yes gene_type:complete